MVLGIEMMLSAVMEYIVTGTVAICFICVKISDDLKETLCFMEIKGKLKYFDSDYISLADRINPDS